MTQSPELPFVTIVIPMRDEEQSLVACLEAVRAQDYPSELMEILVVDGGSLDASPAILERFVAEDDRFRCLDNPSGLVSTALNLGIEAATGDYLLRIDAHTLVDRQFVRSCVQRLIESGADNVGGPMEPRGDTAFGRAIAIAMSCRFGIGTAKFRFAKQVEEVDTVYLGAFPRGLFQRIGRFNPDLVRNQDYEMNYRIRRAGGRILVDPAIRSTYLVRPDLDSLWQQFADYGYWKVEMLRCHPRSLRPRQLAAPGLLAGLVASAGVALAALAWPSIPPELAAGFPLLVLVYLLASLVAAMRALDGPHPDLLWRLPVVFATMHLAWGTGFWRSVLPFSRRRSEREE